MWQHSDPRGLARAVNEARARARARAWSEDAFQGSSGSRVADLRALLVDAAWTAQRLSVAPHGKVFKTSIVAPEGASAASGLILDALDTPTYPSPDRYRHAQGVLRTWLIVAPLPNPLEDMPSRIATSGGSDELREPEAGFWLAAIAIVVGAMVIGPTLLYIAQKAAEIVDRRLARDARVRELVAGHEAYRALLAPHIALEEKAGRPIPMPQSLHDALSKLEIQQDSVSRAINNEPGIRDPFSTFIKNAATAIKKGADSFGWLAVFGAAILVVWMMNEGGRRT